MNLIRKKMKKLTTYACIAVFAAASAGMVGCTPGNNTGGATMAGAAIGALVGGSVAGKNSKWAGAIGGALVGGALGNIVGQKMDAQDKANMENAITTTPVNNQASWTNQSSGVTYTVTPVKQYQSAGSYCREYQTKVTVNGKTQDAYGKACRQPDGTWKIIS
jgi:surface antigen